MVKYQIFISYRRDGGDALAGRLADRFSALGYKVFFDVESMRSGTFNTQILDAIYQCDDVLLVLPPNALDRCENEDDWVRQELAFALKHNKNIIPIMMRGFDFPSILPADIEKIRYMEGVTASSEYFDAVIDRIKNLLTSNIKVSFDYHLETKEYYKIKTPFLNPYKEASDLRRGYLSIAAYISQTYQINGEVKWKAVEGYDSLRDFFTAKNDAYLIEWYGSNADKLNSLRDKIVKLKLFSPDNKKDLYFYENAVLYAVGITKEFLSHNYSIRRVNIQHILSVLCYCIDWPDDMFGELEEAYCKDQGGLTDFKTLLPLPFEVWGNDKGEMKSEYKRQFDEYAILLFDFMLECAILVIDTSIDYEFKALARCQILSYYKYLRKHKLYLPKEIQEKVYRDL